MDSIPRQRDDGLSLPILCATDSQLVHRILHLCRVGRLEGSGELFRRSNSLFVVLSRFRNPSDY